MTWGKKHTSFLCRKKRVLPMEDWKIPMGETTLRFQIAKLLRCKMPSIPSKKDRNATFHPIEDYK